MRRRGPEQDSPEKAAPRVSKPKGPPRPPQRKGGGRKKSSFTFAALGLALLAISLVGVYYYLVLYEGHDILAKNLGHLDPFPGPKVTQLPMFAGEYKESMLWGTYRPHLYLGIRSRVPRSVLAGLMWVAPKSDAFEVRHTCQQGDSALRTYGWRRHNGRSYGRQTIVDGPFNITTFFVKALGSPGSGYGGDWAARVLIKPAPPKGPAEERKSAIPLFFYVADEAARPIQVMPGPWREQLLKEGKSLAKEDMAHALNQAKEGVLARGEAEPYGEWELHFRLHRVGAKMVAWEGMRVHHFHNLSEAVKISLASQYHADQTLTLPHKEAPSSNLAILQLTLYPPAEVDFVFVSYPKGSRNAENVATRVEALSGEALDRKIAEAEVAFEERFSLTFDVSPDTESLPGAAEVAKAALSNLLGGMGYFYGQSRISIPKGHLKSDASNSPQGANLPYWLYWAAPLFTAVPSRSFFPRGFLWDEGFHQLIVRKWDPLLSMDAIAHWLDLLNANGWIPREQILGEEARSFVPEEFVQQHTDNGNPPTLFLPLAALAADARNGRGSEVRGDGGSGHPDVAVPPEDVNSFLQAALPRLERWFLWFNTSQRGALPGSYYWHGRDAESTRELNPKTLQSGLDDYPRASHPSTGERHVDLRCWLALAASALSSIRKHLGKDKDSLAASLSETEEMLADSQLLHELHWDEASGTFADFGNHTEDVRLARVEHVDLDTGMLQRHMERAVGTPPEPQFVPQFGYVSLFPLLLRLLPQDSPSLRRTLEMLRDEGLLWTPYGLRSLSANSSLYMKRNTEHDPPYWRGPIWININYLALSALHHYSKATGPFQETAGQLYQDLRSNLIRNIVKQYNKSGYLWEQYVQSTGRGKGSHPFTGWTALLVLVLAEQYS